MKAGIIGFARSGKTTVFNAITGSQAAVGTFGSRGANVAAIKVPDERVDVLAEIYAPKKKTYAEAQFVDVAPNETGDEAKALDSAALTELKTADALVHVVRAFHNENVLHPLDRLDPVADCRALEEELRVVDFIVLERRLERKEKEGARDREYDLLKRCTAHLEADEPLRTMNLTEQEHKELAGFSFLSMKPILLLGNYGEENIGRADPAGLRGYANEHGFTLIELCGAMETEVMSLPEEERPLFRADLGLGEESKILFIQRAYDTLGLISFLTVRDPELRAWAIPKNTRAVDAAGIIHSDIQRGFIRAEVVHFDDYMVAGSMAKAKEAGKVRLEGKDYIVKDGDIILFRFNV